jgi:hypothetical protein
MSRFWLKNQAMYPIKSCNQNPTPSSYPLVPKFLKLEQMQFLKQKKFKHLDLELVFFFGSKFFLFSTRKSGKFWKNMVF